MTGLREHLTDYLALRRSLGFKLARAAKLLDQFLAHLDNLGASVVTVEAALAWATQPANGDSDWRAYRLGVVRGFARYLHAVDPVHQVPPTGLLAGRSRRATPYPYSAEDIARLMSAARTLRRYPLRAATFENLVGLLAATGMRIGEAIRLDRADIDWREGVLTVAGTKFNKTRLVPLHPATLDALCSYDQRRSHLCPHPADPSFFVSTAGKRLRYDGVHATWLKLVRLAGLEPISAACRPRPHDLRHRFAVTTLLGWYREGVDVQAPSPAAVHLPGPRPPGQHLLVPVRRSRTARYRREPPRDRSPAMSLLAPVLQAFFTDRLIAQRRASPATITSYRDTFRLLLRFAQARTATAPSRLGVEQLDAPLIAAFLEHLEHERGNSVRARNNRLAAIHSLFAYAALHHPEHAETIQRVLAVPHKRTDRELICYLTAAEVDALLAAPDTRTWLGRRDRTLILLAVQTGLRVSELTALTCADVVLGVGAHIRCRGKGRKDRITPLTTQSAQALKAWLAERRGGAGDPLFPSLRRTPLSRDAVALLLAKHAATAAAICPSIATKELTPHVLRHTCAMQLLAAGVDITVIALWLGHEQIESTNIYLHADLTIKERALARTKPAHVAPGPYRPPDDLLAFLEAL
jgi:site-specific recombinase XerD